MHAILRRCPAVLVAGLLPGLLVAEELPRDADRLYRARRAGIAWALRTPATDPGDLWMLSLIDDPDARAVARAADGAPGGRRDPYAGLYQPGRDGGELPRAWAALDRHPYGRMAAWLHAAANAPGRAAPATVLEALVVGRHADYLATHQYLSLRLLRDRGCADGPRVEAALGRMLDDIEAEHRSDPWFSDLGAERVAVLLFGGRDCADMSAWIAMIADNQDPDGSWRVPPHDYPVAVSSSHATLVSVWAIDQYLRLASSS